MPSEFLLQIVHRTDGRLVSWAPGLEVEQELIESIVDRVKQKGVGVMRTEAHVLGDVEAAIRELLYDLKARV